MSTMQTEQVESLEQEPVLSVVTMEYEDVVISTILILRRVLHASKDQIITPETELSQIGEYGSVLSEGLNSVELEDALGRNFGRVIPRKQFNGRGVTVQTVIDYLKRPNIRRVRPRQ